MGEGGEGEDAKQIQDTGFPYLQGQIGSRTLAALASSLKCLKNTKMHVFASFARKRATPRASRSCAVPHRPEAVENAKKAPYPKKIESWNNVSWVGVLER